MSMSRMALFVMPIRDSIVHSRSYEHGSSTNNHAIALLSDIQKIIKLHLSIDPSNTWQLRLKAHVEKRASRSAVVW